MKSIAVVGALWTENFGDVLLAKLFVEELRKYNCRVSLPNSSVNIRNELDCDGGGIFSSDCVIFCGGGYFSEPPGNPMKWALLRYKLIFWYATYCRLMKKPYYILGVGAGPLNSVVSKVIIKHVCKGAKYIAVRDEVSRECLLNLGIKDIDLVADYVLSMKVSPPPYGGDRKRVCFHLSKNASLYLPAIVQFVNDNKDTLDCFFIEDHVGEYEKLSRYYPSVTSAFEGKIILYKDVASLIVQIASFSHVITNKLHVGIVAAVLGKSICSFPYHKKVRRFYEEIGRPELCLDNEQNAREVYRHLEKTLESKPVTLPPELVERSAKISTVIKSIIMERGASL